MVEVGPREVDKLGDCLDEAEEGHEHEAHAEHVPDNGGLDVQGESDVGAVSGEVQVRQEHLQNLVKIPSEWVKGVSNLRWRWG